MGHKYESEKRMNRAEKRAAKRDALREVMEANDGEVCVYCDGTGTNPGEPYNDIPPHPCGFCIDGVPL